MTTDPHDGELVPLGDGPVATVWAGVHATAGEAFALKVFPGRIDRRTRAELSRELARLSALRAHAPVLVADRVEERPDGRCALRMELCAQSLPELLDSFGPLSVADTLVLGTVLATALAAAHGAGLVHGGVVPGNVLFRPSGEPVLSDFGLTLRHAFPRDPLRTADLLPPETVRDGTADERSDLYGLGVVLYLALSGRSPHQGPPGERPEERLLRVLGNAVPPLDRPGMPPELVQVVAALLATDPADRPVSASAVAARLDALRVRVAPADQPPPADHQPESTDHPSPGPDHRPEPAKQRGFDDFATSSPPEPTPPEPTGRPSPGPEHRAEPAEQLGFDDFATPGPVEPAPPAPTVEKSPAPGAEPPEPTAPSVRPTEPPATVPAPPATVPAPPATVAAPPATVPAPPATVAGPPSPGVEPPDRTAGPPETAAKTPGPGAEVSSPAAPRPHGEPILVFGSEKRLRRATRTRSLLIGVGGLALLAAVAVPLLLNRPGELTVPPAPAGVGVVGAASSPARVVRLELADPADHGNFVELSWQSNEPLNFAVIVAAEGEPNRTILAQRKTTYRVPVDPVRRYCFAIQGTDGNQVYESEPKPIRGASCVK
ncbi:protein kinase [Plantactinospora sp. ZYX-F-223]|uniref:serine/threonine protein kinase n=1 Tax=Plantactinospora sp. ZYX-F-223 TaxID=3144103 RepID=UPI0031FCA83F